MPSISTLCLLLIQILLLGNGIVEGNPLITTPRTTNSTNNSTVTFAKKFPAFGSYEATTQNAVTENMSSPSPQKTDESTTLKPEVPSNDLDQKKLEYRYQVPTHNPIDITDVETPFGPSQHIQGKTLGSSKARTTQLPTTKHDAAVTSASQTTKTPLRSQKMKSPIRITRVYRVKSESNCKGRKDHDIKVHIGEGKYLNIKITED